MSAFSEMRSSHISQIPMTTPTGGLIRASSIGGRRMPRRFVCISGLLHPKKAVKHPRALPPRRRRAKGKC
ncbi:hypothetical protein HETIRDRAFT_170504 [Heterobasidion irregulare TC 32-1]|uniref:Uncharacterized protein n=1 Tax=Heterobasidion irregulare (strain TC 32-1) TaxID=747525 RepID=W4KE50_HETIT|nr:uncharacterized protein HETIRDRAFT_170504 [Heterobasidion irregulare TC 32-1]ETW84029.1 hypothetical protein HETIRDRAFT_170504 [Heterobasidion irregulare TC 32-1]